jgi:carboxymethylenebutenolidase
MVVTHESIDIGGMRILLSIPKASSRVPGVLMYSDIFQLTGPQLRASARLAGHGYVVATPEIWNRREPKGTAIPFDDAGRTRGTGNARATRVADFDADRTAVLDLLASHPLVDAARLATFGFCIGGHLAFRAALDPRVRAAACFYPTGVHDGKLGADADAGTLARVGEIDAVMLLVFGTRDPHVPEEARARIANALAGKRVTTRLYDAEHAFMRDEGPRFDPEATDDAWREAIAFLRRAMSQ